MWLDSTAGWLALVDGATKYAMVEKTRHIADGDYPSKATTIFYKNGPTVELNEKGMPYLTSSGIEKTPYYMEAEMNSPMAVLGPGETYSFDTNWFPARLSGELTSVTEAGVVAQTLAARRTGDKVDLAGSFGVFFPGELKAYLYEEGGLRTSEVSLQAVQPQDPVILHQSIAAARNIARVSIHLIDSSGVDRGALGEVSLLSVVRVIERMKLARLWVIVLCACTYASAQIKDDWPSYNGDYTGRRFSGLTQITPQNVAHLQAQWVFHTKTPGVLEGTPVVVNGIMYFTGSNDAFALNAQTGELLWHYSRPVSSGLIDDASGHINRGVAISGTRLYMETDNAHLLCLDSRSGNLIWDVAYADWNKNYGATGAPLILKDKVLVATSGGDDGVRGFLAAFDATTGKLAWRLWTIPAPGEFGSSSWPGDTYLHGGATAWMPGTYDSELNTLYWGTGNASPDYDGSVRPGDDLYTSSLLAIDPDTGKLKWYFQFTPHDLYDYDAVETPVLVDTEYQGQPQETDR